MALYQYTETEKLRIAILEAINRRKDFRSYHRDCLKKVDSNFSQEHHKGQMAQHASIMLELDHVFFQGTGEHPLSEEERENLVKGV